MKYKAWREMFLGIKDGPDISVDSNTLSYAGRNVFTPAWINKGLVAPTSAR